MKYVVRTSLVWIALILAAGAYWYRLRIPKPKPAGPVAVQPLVVGSAPAKATPPPSDATEQREPSLSPVQITPERMQSIGVTTGTVEWKRITDHIRATGTVDINERLISYVQVRFSGYIRDVFANATYQFVRKGDPLFTIYSPDLYAAQNEYLLALRNQTALRGSRVDGVASGADAVVSAAEQRLRQWDIPPVEIKAVKETGKPISELPIASPVSGYITERNALPNVYVEPATRLYTIADLSRIWVYAQIFQDDVGRLKPGDSAQITVDSYSGLVFRGQIESILPQVDMATRTVRVRLDVANPDLKLRPGMFVNVDLETNLGRQLTVPASAVLQSGIRQIAFLERGDGKLEPKEVVTGPRVGDDIIILKGIEAHQRIVTSANFLIDSESQLQAAAGSYAPPPPGVSSAAAAQASQQNAQQDIEFTTDPAPPRKGSNSIRVKLTGSNGAGITGADVTVTFYTPAMPAMGMAAMTTSSKLSGTANGVYGGTGVLQSGGPWQVTILAQKNGQTLATKQLRVNATGGM
jgi:Cu(I)/Ag(I) efflux system membrane fusion protein/cobalt-zinc-cadmium efflux system membrane fusion protein